MIAITHIQNTEPNPPIQIADETPTIFPVHTRDAVETISAWKEEIAPLSSGFSITDPQALLNNLTCGNLVRTVKYTPAPISIMTSSLLYIKELIVPIIVWNIPSFLSLFVVNILTERRWICKFFYILVHGLKTDGRITRYCDRIRKMVKRTIVEWVTAKVSMTGKCLWS